MSDQGCKDWRADFAFAEERRRDASFHATVAERLQWLEEALTFAARVGALKQTNVNSGGESSSKRLP